MIYFLDTSALAKRYLTEKGSNGIRQLLDRKDDVFYPSLPDAPRSRIGFVQTTAFPRTSQNELSFLLRAYVAHSHQEYLLIPYSDALLDGHRLWLPAMFCALWTLFSSRARLNFRDGLPTDALPLSFLSADDRLLDAARQEHLQAQNPEKARF